MNIFWEIPFEINQVKQIRVVKKNNKKSSEVKLHNLMDLIKNSTIDSNKSSDDDNDNYKNGNDDDDMSTSVE